MDKLVVVVDDELDILNLIGLHLTRANYKVKQFQAIKGFREFIQLQQPDLIILDLMLPDGDGLELCKSLKKESRFSSIPIIILSAKGEEVDKILGLELGADDYVTKPFSPKELLARVKAILRRHTIESPSPIITLGNSIVIHTERYEVTNQGQKIELTSTEFKILALLAGKKGRVFSRDQILDHLWGDDKIVIDRTIDVHIRNLRDKLGLIAGAYIKNVRGIGYKVDE